MVMRLVMVFVLLVALTGCLKKVTDENASMDTGVAEETATGAAVDVARDTQVIKGKSVSVESTATQMEVVEKPSVQDIQQALKNANLYEGNIDGVIGPNTRKAIEAFQSQSGLKADGKVGPKTWQKLKEYLVK